MGKLQLDPAFVAKMDRMLQSRAPKPASKPAAAAAAAPAAAKKKKKAPQAGLPPNGPPDGPRDAPRGAPQERPWEASREPRPDLFVIDRAVMEELVSAYVERHVRTLRPEAAAPAPKAAAQPEQARFVVRRVDRRSGKLVERTVGSERLRPTDRVVRMVIE